MATTTLKQHIPIFVSSTYEDMRAYREAVEQSIMSLEHIVKGMELFGSSPETPLEKCLSEVRQSSLFICIIGMRYGSIEKISGRSFTYLEYEEAIKNNIPVLAYLFDEEAAIIAKFVDKDKKAELLVEFKNILKSKHVVSYFDSVADLKSKVNLDIIDALKKMNNIEMSKDGMFAKVESSVEIMKKFINRPKKYNGREVEIIIKLIGEFRYSWIVNFTNRLGLTRGDMVGIKVRIIDESGNEISDLESIDLHADGDMADLLEKHIIGNVLKIRARLTYITFDKIEDCDDGKKLFQYDKSCLILIDILEQKQSP